MGDGHHARSKPGHANAPTSEGSRLPAALVHGTERTLWIVDPL